MLRCLVAAVLLTMLTTLAHSSDAGLRGLWMAGASFATPEKAAATVERACAAHLNALFPLVWSSGRAYFRCDGIPWGQTVPAGFDPLANLVTLAHARGLQVHPWFVNGSCGTVQPGSVADQRPQWLVQPGQRIAQPWYDLAQPEVRRFEVQAMMDCLSRYEVDGLHYDYIRFGSQVYCYCDHCQQEMKKHYGFAPLHKDAGQLPLLFTTVGNPLADLTTARPLACFENGEPAVTLNRLGSGETALLNWQAFRYLTPSGDRLTEMFLRRFGATADGVYQLHTTQTAAAPGTNWQSRTADWLKGLGYTTRRVSETELAQVPAGGLLVLAAQYRIAAETAAALKQFMLAGGHLLVVDGPRQGMESADLQQVIGLKTSAPLFYGLRWVVPAPGQDLLPAAPGFDLTRERERIPAWVQYRKAAVTDLVREVRQAARKIKPQAQISAAVFYTRWEADGVCQDWYRWLREDLIDYAIPMAYTENDAELQAALKEWQAADPAMERIIPGLGIWTNRNGKDVTRPSEAVIRQIGLCRAAGARGNLLFSVNCLSEQLAADLAAGPYAE